MQSATYVGMRVIETGNCVLYEYYTIKRFKEIVKSLLHKSMIFNL